MLHAVSDEVREMLAEYAGEIVNEAESSFAEVIYIPVTAFGRSPEQVDDQSNLFGIRPRDVHSQWTEFPMLYALHKAAPRLVPVASHKIGVAKGTSKPANAEKSNGAEAVASRRRRAAEGDRLMGQEILYTSAPQGLRQGSSGFCTVGSTAGMEPNLAEFLEGFSGYPHPYKPPDPRTKDNPVNYSFIQWTIGGQRYYVLSRVCDAGLDHTGRTNLLAHHVALTRREIDRCPGGPAYVMAAGDFFITEWNKQLQTLAGQKPRGGDLPLQKCVAWEQAAGDAGYAGVLAEAAKEKGGKPVSVIYPAGPGRAAADRRGPEPAAAPTAAGT